MRQIVVSLTDVSKSYGPRKALDRLSLDIPQGSFCALLGPNGAGKTTMLRILMGFIRPDSGRGEVLGEPLGLGYPTTELKARIGYVPEKISLYESMTAREVLDLCRQLNKRWDQEAEERYCHLFGLPTDLRVRHMSTGMKTQLTLTAAMSGRPELLILDEPTKGLDALQRYRFLKALLEDTVDSGTTVILASHDLDQIERIADNAFILRQGRACISGPIDRLKEEEKRVRVAGSPDHKWLSELPGVRRISRDSGGYLLHVSGHIDRLTGALASSPQVSGFQVVDQSLEEIFLSYVEGGL